VATALIDDPLFLEHRTGVHPETPERLRAIRHTLEGEANRDLARNLVCYRPRAASDSDLARCHSPGLIDGIREAARDGVERLDPDTVISLRSFEVASRAAGAAITAVDVVLNGEADSAFVPARPPGHHARPDAAMGFCLFNNAAIAARYAQAERGVERVLIVDWDVHHGNGTQEIFYEDPSVFYLSTHQYPYYPGTGSRTETGLGPGDGTTLNVPLRGGTSARDHLSAFVDALEESGRRFTPDLVIVSSGFDARRGDPLGGLMLDDADFTEMTRRVVDFAGRIGRAKVVSLLEGGYNLQTLGGAVSAHLRGFS
jgi:acetoin utilization deacetylase AcuC-like enzyme